MRIDATDAIGGAICAATGAFFALNAAGSLAMGTASRMGPGYFPVVLGVLLAVIGVVLMLRALWGHRRLDTRVSLRAVALVGGAPLMFAVAIAPLGLFLTVALMCLLACLASRENAIGRSVIVSLGLAAFCCVVFLWGLGQSIPVTGYWFG